MSGIFRFIFWEGTLIVVFAFRMDFSQFLVHGFIQIVHTLNDLVHGFYYLLHTLILAPTLVHTFHQIVHAFDDLLHSFNNLVQTFTQLRKTAPTRT